MRYTLKEAFDDIFMDVKFDANVAKALYQFRVGYMTGNREHMEFFGGNMIGVNTLRFKDSDVNNFFAIFDMSYQEVIQQVRQVTTIDHKFKVGSDVFNLTCMYLIHRFLTSKNPVGLIEKATYDVAMIFFCRCCAALISANFKYQADPKVAQMAYANLSQKYLIKKLGSWNRVLDYRVKALLDKRESPHKRTFLFFDEDPKIQYAITDSQGRIREMFKGYYSELMMVNAEGGSISIQKSLTTDAEGDEALREKTHGPENYVFYLREIVTDEQTFIRDDFLQLVSRSNTNTSLRAVKTTLEWISKASTDPKHYKLVDDFLTRSMVMMAYFMQYNIEASRQKDLNYVLANLKNLFLSTRSVDPDLLYLRELGEKIIDHSQGKMSVSLMMATRTAVIMYICLRALVGKSTI